MDMNKKIDDLSLRELRQSLEAIDRIEIKADWSSRIFYRFSNQSAYSSTLFINAQHST
ncbi:hypothetical protein GGQ95_002111 [Anoxybacillus rupiensis]|nr:hypothetical protein [Anoxybacillus rupiensis]